MTSTQLTSAQEIQAAKSIMSQLDAILGVSNVVAGGAPANLTSADYNAALDVINDGVTGEIADDRLDGEFYSWLIDQLEQENLSMDAYADIARYMDSLAA